MDTSTLNPLISGEEIEANRMHRNSIHFDSQAHLIFMGNHRPSASAASGIWRRLCLIQFRHKPETPNPRLKAELAAELLPGILAWMLEGLRACGTPRANSRSRPSSRLTLKNTPRPQTSLRRYVQERLRQGTSRVEVGALLRGLPGMAPAGSL